MSVKQVIIIGCFAPQIDLFMPKKFKEEFPEIKFSAIISTNALTPLRAPLLPLLDPCDEVVYLEPTSEDLLGGHFDPAILREKILEAAKGYDMSEVRVYTCDENNIQTIADAVEGLGIDRWDAKKSQLFKNKNMMKEYLAKFNIRVPKNKRLEPTDTFAALAAQFDVPFVIKPVDSASSIGFLKTTTQEEFDDYMSTANFETTEYGVEEFITGTLHHVDSVVVKGKILTVLPHQYIAPQAEYILGKANGSICLSKDHPLAAPIIEFNKSVMEAFAIDGAFHHEVFVNTKGEVIFLEIAWRQAGFPGSEAFTQLHGVTQSYAHMKYDIMGCSEPMTDYNTLFDNYKEMQVFVPRKEGRLEYFTIPPLASGFRLAPVAKEGETFEKSTAYFQLAFKMRLVGNYETLKKDFAVLSTLSNFVTSAKVETSEQPK